MNAVALRQELAVLTETAAALAEAGLDLPVLADTVTDLLVTHVADMAMLHLLGDDGVTLDLASVASRDPHVPDFVREVLETRPRRVDDPSPLGSCFTTGRPFVVDEAEVRKLANALNDRYQNLAHGFDLHGVCYAPLLAEGRSFGVAAVMRYGKAATAGFHEAEVELVCNIAELAAPSIWSAVAHDRLAEATALFETAFACAPIGMAIHSIGPAPSRFIRANATLCAIVDRSADDLAGTPVAALVAAPERARVDVLLAEMAIGEVDANSDELLLVRRDGSTVAVWIDSRVVRSDGDAAVILTQVQPLASGGG